MRGNEMILAKDGTIITQSGNTITCSNCECYVFSGTILTGSNGFCSMNVKNIAEAIGIIIGIHGGRSL